MKKWIALATLGIACCAIVTQFKIDAKRSPSAPVTASAAHPG